MQRTRLVFQRGRVAAAERTGKGAGTRVPFRLRFLFLGLEKKSTTAGSVLPLQHVAGAGLRLFRAITLTRPRLGCHAVKGRLLINDA